MRSRRRRMVLSGDVYVTTGNSIELGRAYLIDEGRFIALRQAGTQ